MQVTEPKQKKPSLDNMRVLDSTAQEVRVAAAEQNRFIYEVAADAWEAYKLAEGRADGNLSALTQEQRALVSAFVTLLVSGDARDQKQILPTVRQYLSKTEAKAVTPHMKAKAS